MNPKVVLANLKVSRKWKSQKASMASLKKASKFMELGKVSAARVQFAREFYTKVFAYRLAFEIRKLQRIREEQGKPLSRDTVHQARDLVKSLSPVVDGFSRKSIDGNYHVIQGSIRIFSPKGFEFRNISLENAQKFIDHNKMLFTPKQIEKMKPKVLSYLDKPVAEKKPVAVVSSSTDFSYLKRIFPSNMGELHKEAQRLRDVISIHRVGGEEAEAEEFEAELVRVEEEIRKRDEAKKKNSSFVQ